MSLQEKNIRFHKVSSRLNIVLFYLDTFRIVGCMESIFDWDGRLSGISNFSGIFTVEQLGVLKIINRQA